jgi:hypothetical protein
VIELMDSPLVSIVEEAMLHESRRLVEGCAIVRGRWSDRVR